MAPETLTIRSLRRHAIAHSLFAPATLQEAIDALGFVQADPIRSPARAQDLILRHRVVDYQAGDLEQQYASLDVEEDYLYAYGFLSRRIWHLLHPRKTSPVRNLERKVLELVHRLGETHPAALQAHLGKRRIVNAWGGYSKATTNALEWLHWRGLLRIARREAGVRLYRVATLNTKEATKGERLREIIMVHADIFAPTPERSLRAVIARHRDLGQTGPALTELIQRGELRKQIVDNVSYIWPAAHTLSNDAPRLVRFLAPFDPVIWDRRRFEHLWGWAYRFEAYTPRSKRVRGYYAMPLLWGDSIPGWANAPLEQGRLKVDVGFVGQRPRGREFTRELDAEVARLEQFLTTGGRAYRLQPSTA